MKIKTTVIIIIDTNILTGLRVFFTTILSLFGKYNFSNITRGMLSIYAIIKPKIIGIEIVNKYLNIFFSLSKLTIATIIKPYIYKSLIISNRYFFILFIFHLRYFLLIYHIYFSQYSHITFCIINSLS